MRDIEKLLAGANSAMREKLEENSHKGGWQDMSIFELMKYSDIETAEIRLALYFYQFSSLGKQSIDSLINLKRELADRMNFDAMMIDRCNALIEKNKEFVDINFKDIKDGKQ